MELQRSSNPKLHIHHKQQISSPLSHKYFDYNLHSHMEGNSAGAGDLIPGEEHSTRVMEETNKLDHGDVESDVFFRGWSKTGKRKEKCTRARVNITGFSQDEEESSRPGKQKLMIPLIKKRKYPSSGEPGNDGVSDPGAERAVLASMDDDGNPTESRKEHVCNICNRSFKSYQALGGHKAHHNSDDKGDDFSFTEEIKSESASRRPRKTDQFHQCTVCYRIFSQGQALGGHKRHCRGPDSRGGDHVGSENRPRVPDFDLNELPPEWIPDE